MLPQFTTLRLAVSGRIANVVFDHPSLNLLDAAMVDDLDCLGRWLADQMAITVVVFASANADFFMAHADLAMLQDMPLPDPAMICEPSPHQRIFDRFHKLPQLTIVKLRGIARGGGSEFLLALDLRYAAIEHAVVAQPEVPLGFPPGCGATQRLPALVGRAHAIEAIVGGRDYRADEAAHIGWLNRAMPDAELDSFVDDLAQRVASYPGHAVAAAKAAIDYRAGSLDAGLAVEFAAFLSAYAQPETKSRLSMALRSGFQTVALETQPLDGWLKSLGELYNTGGLA